MSHPHRAHRHVVSIDGFEDVPPNSEEALRSAVAHQPVSVAIEADQKVRCMHVHVPTCGLAHAWRPAMRRGWGTGAQRFQSSIRITASPLHPSPFTLLTTIALSRRELAMRSALFQLPMPDAIRLSRPLARTCIRAEITLAV